MTRLETITTRTGIELAIETRTSDPRVEITLKLMTSRACLLHWGLTDRQLGAWRAPPSSAWPDGSFSFGPAAVRTPFTATDGYGLVGISIEAEPRFPLIAFALFFPDEQLWDNNRGRNYYIALPVTRNDRASITGALEGALQGQEILFQRIYPTNWSGQLAAAVSRNDRSTSLVLVSTLPGPLLLHWGIPERPGGRWNRPQPSTLWPPGTLEAQGGALQTPFSRHSDLWRLEIAFPRGSEPISVAFVVRDVPTGQWFKDNGKDFFVPVALPPSGDGSPWGDPVVSHIAQEIIQRETGGGSWSLMHRYDLCHDLVDRVRAHEEGLALIFVWLRYSALRQLDWQRRYNTKPRELSHSMDRLARRLADIYSSEPLSRRWVRLILTTIGRGGEGQRIRDEILEIMHRHHIKEVSGHFIEEWHQKIHNNTTPDDIAICRAYLEFLKSNGDLGVFYGTLQTAGVTKERLESFDRPLKTPPDFVPHLKDALIADFSHFLTTLKSVHEGTDLEVSVEAARRFLDPHGQGLLDWVRHHHADTSISVVERVEKAVQVRRVLSGMLAGPPIEPPILFLDVTLEALVRTFVEQHIHEDLSGDERVELFGLALQNWLLSGEDAEGLAPTYRSWTRLAALPRFDRQWVLHARAILDRTAYILASFGEQLHRVLQPKARLLGRALLVEESVEAAFTEEVVRGSTAFVLSLLHHRLDPLVRTLSGGGTWQVVSLGSCQGRIQTIETLSDTPADDRGEPSVLVAQTIRGDEQIPQGVVGIVTARPIDLLSHVAIRARNAGVLLAACYDEQTLERLRSFEGRLLELAATGPDQVRYEVLGVREASSTVLGPARHRAPRARFTLAGSIEPWTAYVVGPEQFRDGVVGNKSLNLIELRDAVPDWIHIPPSVALPFGTFEKVLEDGRNLTVRDQYSSLLARLDQEPSEVLPRLRTAVLSLEAPPGIETALRDAMTLQGLRWPARWPRMWQCIKTVWASKWTDRAYYSRKEAAFPHEALFMAVLIQQAVEADYSFVIHTVDPVSPGSGRMYAEVVLGLGEVLTGNHPGRALGVFLPKGDGEPLRYDIAAYPSKNEALYGDGLIFRSDSNGEDLEGWAGAGLYESVMLDVPNKATPDYSDDPLLWDEGFKEGFFSTIAKIGRIVEGIFQCPQDIEGAFRRGDVWLFQSRAQVGIHEATKTDTDR